MSSSGIAIDPYKTLGLSHDATSDDIRKAYKKLALKYHPDRCNNNSVSDTNNNNDDDTNIRPTTAKDDATATHETKMAEINEAYGILKDGEQKRRYDYLYKYGGVGAGGVETAGGNTNDYSDQRIRRQRQRQRQRQQSYNMSPMVNDPFFNSSSKGGGFSFTFTSTSTEYIPGSSQRVFIRKTTKFQNGQKYTQTDSTTIHPDGRAERNATIFEEENATLIGDMIKNMLGLSSKPNVSADRTSGSDRGDESTTEQQGKNGSLPWYHKLSDQLRKCSGCNG